MRQLKPLNFCPGQRYDYLGDLFQVMAVDDKRVQLRSVVHSGKILYPSLERLSRAHLQGNLIFVQEAPFSPNPMQIMAELSEKHKNEVNRRKAYVTRLVAELGPHLPVKRTREIAKTIAQELGESHPPCYTTLYEWVKKYKYGGGKIFLLIPNTHRKRGRRLDHQPGEIQNIINGIITGEYEGDHQTAQQHTLPPLSRAIVIDFIEGEIDNLNKNRRPNHQLKMPSKSTLYRILNEIDYYTLDKYYNGKNIADSHAKWNKVYRRSLRALEIVECDTQKMDVEVVDKEGKVVGRPYLTKCIDVRTRCVLGWDISLNPPSVDKTLRALFVSLLEGGRFGGLAILYVVDNGSEFLGERLRIKMHDLGAEIRFCKIKHSDGKPHIEASFKTWTRDLAQHLPGTTLSSVADKHEYDPEANAELTLDAIRSVFSKWLDCFYHQHFHSGLGMSPEEARDEQVTNEIALKKYSAEDLDRHFLCLGHAKPDNKGRVTVNNVSWKSGAVSFLYHLKPDPKYLCVLYDRSDLGRAWVYHPDYPEQLQPLDPVDELQIGMTMSLHQMLQDKLTTRKKERRYFDARQERANLLREYRSSQTKKGRKQAALIDELLSQPVSVLDNAPKQLTTLDVPFHSDAPEPTRPYLVIEVNDDSNERLDPQKI